MTDLLESTSTVDQYKQHSWPAAATYYEQPLVLERGEGMHVWDDQGNRYLDCFGGVLTVSVGHANADVNKAIHAQIDKITHTSTLYVNKPVAELGAEVARVTPGALSRSFFSNSGTEADETAMLLARYLDPPPVDLSGVGPQVDVRLLRIAVDDDEGERARELPLEPLLRHRERPLVRNIALEARRHAVVRPRLASGTVLCYLEVLAGLRVLDAEVDLLQHQLLDVSQCDVAAGFRVVEPAIGIFLDDPGLLRHGAPHVRSSRYYCRAASGMQAKGLKIIGKLTVP